MQITGTIIAVLPVQSGVSARGNAWMKQDYVIEVPGQYPKRCTFNIFGEDRIKQFNIQQGEKDVTVEFDIDAHEWNGRWFNDVRAYNVYRVADMQPANAAQPASQQPAQQAPQGSVGYGSAAAPAPAQDNSDELPF